MSRKPWLARFLSQTPPTDSRQPTAGAWLVMRQLERRRVLAADITGVEITPEVIVEGDTVTVAAQATGVGVLEFDWVVSRDSTPIAEAFTQSFDFTALEEGVYQVSLKVTDQADQVPDTLNFEITVLNAPPEVTATTDQTLPEGSLLDLSGANGAPYLATFTDPGVNDTHSATVDWGDGHIEAADVTYLNGIGLVAGSHTYADNGTYTVVVTVLDGDGGVASDTLEVQVTNVAPQLNPISDQTVNEGSPLEIEDLGQFWDPGFDNPLNTTGETEESFTYSIDWGDGSPLDTGNATIDQMGTPDGELTRGSFNGSHIYADNGTYTVTVTLMDDDMGVATQRFQVVVNNVRPMLGTIDDRTVEEGTPLNLQDAFEFTDPGFANPDNPNGATQETFSYSIDWGDGTASTIGIPTILEEGSPGMPTRGSFGGQHVYADNGTYTVRVTVTDDDGGVAVETFQVLVTNVAPTFVSDETYTLKEGEVFTLADLQGTAIGLTDPGFDNPANVLDPSNGGETQETFVGMTIDWGDGTAPVPVAVVNRVSGGPEILTTATFSHEEHAYADNGTYTVRVTFSDDDGGVTTGVFTIVVENVAPTLNLTDQQFEIHEGQTVTIPQLGTFYDPGFDNPLNSQDPGDGREVAETFWVTIDWNDGSPLQTIPGSALTWTTGSQGVDTTGTLPGIEHFYADNDYDNVYEVTVTLYDDDGGIDTHVLEIRVLNVSPTLGPLIATDVNSQGLTTLTFSFNDPGADEFDIYIDWGDGNFGAPYDVHYGPTPDTLVIAHYYTGPPNPNNPAGDITIRVQIGDDDSRVAGVVEDGWSNIEDVTISQPGTGTNTIVTFPVPLELGGATIPQTFDASTISTSPTYVVSQSDVTDNRSGGGEVAATSERYFELVTVNPDGTIGDRFRLSEEMMNDLPALFRKLHDDHYRIYLVRTENQSYRLVIDVVTRGGRMTVVGDASDGTRDRPPEAVEFAPDARPGDQGKLPPLEGEEDSRVAPEQLLEGVERDMGAIPPDSQGPSLDDGLLTTTGLPTPTPNQMPSSQEDPTGALAARATAALAAASVVVDPRTDWAVRLERAFAAADTRHWRRLRRRRPR